MIVVTAPTGQIGSKVVRRLLDAGGAVRVVVRDPARLPSEVRERVDVVEGSHGDAGVVARAFDGADAVFWLPPPQMRAARLDDAYTGFTRPAAAAFAARGVRRVVGISALGRGTAQSARAGYVTASLAMDDLVANSGVAYRAVTCPSFFDNLLRQVASIRDRGVFQSAVDPARKLPGCATRDIAATATRLLLADDWTGAGHVAVLGPEDLSADDMAATMSYVLGKPVRCERVGFEALKAQMSSFGASDAMAEGRAAMMRAKDEGLDEGEPRTAENTTPTSFRQWCEEELKPAIDR